MNSDISAVLFDERELKKRICELGTELSKAYFDKNPVLICILKGSVVFLSDLMRHITVPIEIDFIRISSYDASTKSSGVITLKMDVKTNIENRHVVIVEDIIDTGLSIVFLREHLSSFKPESIVVCALLDKPEAHLVDIDIEFKGFEIGNEFVVGYGLDFDEKYRNLPFIGILKKEVYIEPQ